MARLTRAQKHEQDIHRAGVVLARMAHKRGWMEYHREATTNLNADSDKGLSIKILAPVTTQTAWMQIPIQFTLPDTGPVSERYPTAAASDWNNRDMVHYFIREMLNQQGPAGVAEFLTANNGSTPMAQFDRYTYTMNRNDYDIPQTRFSAVAEGDKLTNALPVHVTDMQKISDEFYRLARANGWCEEFETCVEKLNKVLYVELPKPETKLRKTIYIQVDVTESPEGHEDLVAKINQDYYEAQRKVTSEVKSMTPEQVLELFQSQEGVEIRPTEARIMVSTRG